VRHENRFTAFVAGSSRGTPIAPRSIHTRAQRNRIESNRIESNTTKPASSRVGARDVPIVGARRIGFGCVGCSSSLVPTPPREWYAGPNERIHQSRHVGPARVRHGAGCACLLSLSTRARLEKCVGGWMMGCSVRRAASDGRSYWKSQSSGSGFGSRNTGVINVPHTQSVGTALFGISSFLAYLILANCRTKHNINTT